MEGKRKKYSRLFKQNAVLLSSQYPSEARLERELGIYAGALKKWQQKAVEIEKAALTEKRPAKSNSNAKEVRALKRKIERSQLKFEVLKKAGLHLHRKWPNIFNFMAENEKLYSIRLMSDTLNINRSVYRKWKNRILTERQQRKAIVKEKIASIFFASKQCYGAPRIRAELNHSGVQVSISTVRKYMNELGLRSKIKN